MADKNYKLTFSLSDGSEKSVTFTAPQGVRGETGETGATGARGSSVLRVTTAPSSYTTATGGFTPTYRIALNTVLTQSKSADVKIGDTMIYNYYTYPVGYVDSSYVYLGARVSIRGSTGAQGEPGKDGTDATVTTDSIKSALGYTPANQEDVNSLSEDIASLSEKKVDVQQGVANVGKILAIGSDGNIVLVDMPTGGGDVSGFVDESNNIVLTGDLADGDYTLKYQNEDGSYTTIGTLVVVPPVTAVDILSTYTVHHNARWSSSSKATKALNGMICVQMPFADVWDKTIRFSGFDMSVTTNTQWFSIATSNLNTFTGLLTNPVNSYLIHNSTTLVNDDGVYRQPIDATSFPTMADVDKSLYTLSINMPVKNGAAITEADLAALTLEIV
jgi:ethanolamine utilization microcompartment shell protein EutS